MYSQWICIVQQIKVEFHLMYHQYILYTLSILLRPFNGHFSRTTWVQPVPEKMWMALASDGPYANNLHLASDR